MLYCDEGNVYYQKCKGRCEEKIGSLGKLFDVEVTPTYLLTLSRSKLAKVLKDFDEMLL